MTGKPVNLAFSKMKTRNGMPQKRMEGMKSFFPKAWFATETHINNRLRFINFSDRGQLSFDSKKLHFTGRKQSLDVTKIQKVEIISPPLPWMSITLSAAGLLIVSGFFLSFLPFNEVFLVMAGFGPFLFIFLSYLIFVQRAVVWIEITYARETNTIQRAYFLDSSRFALSIFGSMLDDTLGMYKQLKSNLLPAGQKDQRLEEASIREVKRKTKTLTPGPEQTPKGQSAVPAWVAIVLSLFSLIASGVSIVQSYSAQQTVQEEIQRNRRTDIKVGSYVSENSELLSSEDRARLSSIGIGAVSIIKNDYWRSHSASTDHEPYYLFSLVCNMGPGIAQSIDLDLRLIPKDQKVINTFSITHDQFMSTLYPRDCFGLLVDRMSTYDRSKYLREQNDLAWADIEIGIKYRDTTNEEFSMERSLFKGPTIELTK